MALRSNQQKGYKTVWMDQFKIRLRCVSDIDLENSPDGNPEYYMLVSSQTVWEYQDDGNIQKNEDDGKWPQKKMDCISRSLQE